MTYTLSPSREFAAEQKAANRRQHVAKVAVSPLQQQTIAPLLEQAKDSQNLAAPVDKTRHTR